MKGGKARQAFKIADVLSSTTSVDVLDWLPMSMYSTHLLTVLAPDTYLIIASPQCKNFKTSKTSRTWICDVLTTKKHGLRRIMVRSMGRCKLYESDACMKRSRVARKSHCVGRRKQVSVVIWIWDLGCIQLHFASALYCSFLLVLFFLHRRNHLFLFLTTIKTLQRKTRKYLLHYIKRRQADKQA